MKINAENLVDRFIDYVKIDTQSSENSTSYPSTEKQLVLSQLLEKQLRAMGLSNVRLTEHGYVFGTLPSNLPNDFKNVVPTIGFIAHVDTSPAVSGKDVNPVIQKNYQGGDLNLANGKVIEAGKIVLIKGIEGATAIVKKQNEEA